MWAKERVMKDMVNEQLALSRDLANIRVQEYAYKAQIETCKKQTQGNHEIALVKARAAVLADVASRRELQQLDVEIGEKGEIVIRKEAFGGEVKGRSQFSVIENRLFKYSIAGDDKLVLFVRFLDQSSLAKSIYFAIRDCDERLINKKFTISGISFGFGREKEKQIRRMLYARLLQTAILEEIPPAHGWYEINNEIHFAFPEELWIGEEVERYVGSDRKTAR